MKFYLEFEVERFQIEHKTITFSYSADILCEHALVRREKLVLV